jgi:hypothetical protein
MPEKKVIRDTRNLQKPVIPNPVPFAGICFFAAHPESHSEPSARGCRTLCAFQKVRIYSQLQPKRSVRSFSYAPKQQEEMTHES